MRLTAQTDQVAFFALLGPLGAQIITAFLPNFHAVRTLIFKNFMTNQISYFGFKADQSQLARLCLFNYCTIWTL